jgi:hypothetical protein
MRDLILRQKQVLFFIIAGGLSAIVEIGVLKYSALPSSVFPRETNFHGIHYPLSNIFSQAAESSPIISEHLVCF